MTDVFKGSWLENTTFILEQFGPRVVCGYVQLPPPLFIYKRYKRLCMNRMITMLGDKLPNLLLGWGWLGPSKWML